MYTSDSDKLLLSRIDDAISLSITRQKPYFIAFMSERKQAAALSYLRQLRCEDYLFYGGYEDSERKMLGIFYDEKDIKKFPVSAVEFKFRPCDKLSHRDFLGALMALGIERETVGDILIEDGRCVVFVKTEIKDYIASQISKIGNVGVIVKEADLELLPQGRGREEKFFTVSSLRLDNIVSAVCGCSREKTRSVILSGEVCVNYLQKQDVSYNLKPGDVFSVRGFGKFIFNNMLGLTKKGRLKISVIYFR